MRCAAVIWLLPKSCSTQQTNAGADVNRIFRNQHESLLDVAEKRMNAAKERIEDASEPDWAREKSKTSYVEWKEMFDLLLELGAKSKSET
jgi:hypothetical protein